MENTQLTPEQARIADLELQLEASNKENASLKEQLAEKTSANANLEEQLSEQNKVIVEQHTQLTEQVVASPAASVTITVNKKKYAVMAPSFDIDGTKHVAEDLVKDKELAKKLVEMGSGILKEIV